MGCLECDRTNCRNVMSDFRVYVGDEIHYLCGECNYELTAYKNTWQPPLTESEIEKLILDFVESPKGSHKPPEHPVDIDEVFHRIVRVAP